VIAKVEADANPIIWVAFSSDQHSPLEVTDVASRIVKPRLQTLPGAADVRIFGERKFAMRVWLDRDRLAAHNLTPAGGRGRAAPAEHRGARRPHREPQREFSVVAQTDLASRRSSPGGGARPTAASPYPVRIRDVGRVEIGAASERSSVRFNGRRRWRWASSSRRRPIRSTLSRALRAELPKVTSELPPGMEAKIAYDSSVFIERSIEAVFTTIGEAMLLVVLIIFFFLRNVRATLIPLVTIPVSLVGAFAADAGARLHDQYADPAGAGAGHRPGGRRRDRGAGEHLPPHRAGHGPPAGGASRAPGDRLRGGGDDASRWPRCMPRWPS
jgi:multidrug efflux pump